MPGQQLYSQTALSYAGLAFTGTYTDYQDAACTSTRGVSTWTGTVSVGAATAAGAKPIDLAFDTYRYRLLTAEAASTNNQYMYCGFTDWVPNAERDVLGRTCFGFSIPVGGLSLDLYQVERDTLLFGAGAKIGTAPTEADRPPAIDHARVFTRMGPTPRHHE